MQSMYRVDDEGAEADSFPAAEAATHALFAERLARYDNHFWLMFDGVRLVSFVDGFVTDRPDLTDEMLECAEGRSK